MNKLIHLNSASDLITTHSEVRVGFIAMALEKNRRTIPFIEEARALKVLALQATKPSDLLEVISLNHHFLWHQDYLIKHLITFKKMTK